MRSLKPWKWSWRRGHFFWASLGSAATVIGKPWRWALAISALVGVPGLVALHFVLVHLPLTLAVLVAVLLLFIVVFEGTFRQHERLNESLLQARETIDAWNRIEFSCRPRVEAQHPANMIVANNRQYTRNVGLWVDVTNDGPTADFYARVKNVVGVPWSNYEVEQPLWEHTADARVEIPGHGGKRKLNFANVARAPRAFWFNTGETGGRAVGNQWLMEHMDKITITFDLEIVNVSRNDQILQQRGVIEIPSEVDSLPNFTLQ